MTAAAKPCKLRQGLENTFEVFVPMLQIRETEWKPTRRHVHLFIWLAQSSLVGPSQTILLLEKNFFTKRQLGSRASTSRCSRYITFRSVIKVVCGGCLH